MRAVGLELGPRAVRIAVGGNRRGKLSQAVCASLPLPDNSPETIAAVVAGWLGEQAKGLRQLNLALPLRDCAVKIVSFPATSEDNLARLAQAEAVSQLPLPVDAIDYSHAVIDSGRAGESASVAIAACRKETVAALLDAFGTLDLRVPIVDVSVLAMVNALADQARRDSPSALLWIGDDGAELAVVDARARLQAVRGLGAALGEPLAEELRRTLQAYAAGGVEPVGRVILAGPRLREVEPLLGPALGLPIERAEPLDEPGAADAPSFAVAAGLALRGGPTPLRLNLRQRLQTARRQERRQTSLAGAAVAAIFLLLLTGAGTFALRWRDQVKTLDRLTTEKEQLDGDLEALGSESREFLDHLTANRELVIERGRWLPLLRSLTDDLPGGVAVAELTLERDRPVMLRGEAMNNGDVTQAVDAIAGMGLFARVDLDSSNAEQIGDEVVFNYQIRCYWPEPTKRQAEEARR